MTERASAAAATTASLVTRAHVLWSRASAASHAAAPHASAQLPPSALSMNVTEGAEGAGGLAGGGGEGEGASGGIGGGGNAGGGGETESKNEGNGRKGR